MIDRKYNVNFAFTMKVTGQETLPKEYHQPLTTILAGLKERVEAMFDEMVQNLNLPGVKVTFGDDE